MPKIIGGSLAEHREQVRARVFDALREQLYEHGFDAVTLAGVAARAGLGRTAIYNHFPDRESLLVAFVEDEAARYVQRLREAVGAAENPVEQLAVFVRMQLRVLAEQHLPPGSALASTLGPSAYRRVAAHADPITGMLREILDGGMRAGVFAGEDRELVSSMITSSLSNRRLVEAPGSDVERTIEAATRVVLRAAGVAHLPG